MVVILVSYAMCIYVFFDYLSIPSKPLFWLFLKILLVLVEVRYIVVIIVNYAMCISALFLLLFYTPQTNFELFLQISALTNIHGVMQTSAV